LLFHRLFQEGNPQFIDQMKNRKEIFLSKKLTRIEGHQSYGAFILKYGRYLSEKCTVFSLFEIQFEKSPNCLLDAKNIKDRLKILNYIQSQLNGLLNCKIKIYQEVQPCIQQAYNLLGKDLFLLFELLKKALPPLLKQFRMMSKANACSFLSIYKLYEKEIIALDSFLQYGREYMENVPELIPPSQTSLDDMQKYVTNLTVNNTSRNNQKKTLTKNSSPPTRKTQDYFQDFNLRISHSAQGLHQPSSFDSPVKSTTSHCPPRSTNPFISLSPPQSPVTSLSQVPENLVYLNVPGTLNLSPPSPEISPHGTPNYSPTFPRISPRLPASIEKVNEPVIYPSLVNLYGMNPFMNIGAPNIQVNRVDGFSFSATSENPSPRLNPFLK
jgi:hypothetical protein